MTSAHTANERTSQASQEAWPWVPVERRRCAWGQPSVARASAAPLHMALHIPSRCETWRAAAHRAEPSPWPSTLGNREISRETGTAGPRGGGCCTSELVSRPTPLRAWTLGTCRARVSAAIRVSVRVRIRVRVRVWVRGLEFASIFPGAHLQAKRTGGHSREGDAGAGSSARSAGSSLVTRTAASDHGSLVAACPSAAARPRSRACSGARRPFWRMWSDRRTPRGHPRAR